MPLMVRSSIILFSASVFAAAFSLQANALEGSWQVGLNVGVSQLSPDTDGSSFTLDDDRSTLLGAHFSLDVTPIFAAELAFTDLGEAELSQNQTIAYQAISVGATAYLWGEADADRRSDGASGYVRLGLSAIDNDSAIRLTEANNSAIWVAAGVQFPMSDRWGFRAEAASYDGDAQALLAGIYWRAGVDRRRMASPLQTRTLPQPNRTAADAAVVPETVPTPRPQSPQVVPQPQTEPVQPRQTPTAANCPAEAAARISDPVACALLNSSIAGLAFDQATAAILPATTTSLNPIVAALTQNPAVVVEIRAHVQDSGNADNNAQLSAQRARSVARYLVQNGVRVSQLRAKAFGATQPLASGSSPQAQRLNNRIELRTL